MTAAQTLLKNLQGQEDPDEEMSKEELEWLGELDELLEDDDTIPYDWEFYGEETDNPFPAELWIGTTLCCGQPYSEQ
ncbi:MAG TPA: hypothetical protein VGL94_09000 [Ktedonobacteraceae bacterium]|jgi:hypothetical protein